MDKAEQLKQVELFSQLDEKYLEVLAPSCHEKSFASGERLVEQGEEGIGLMIITSGKVRVVKKTAAGDEIEVATHGAGEFIGEMTVLDGAVRSASVVAVDDTQCLILSSWAFKGAMAGNPEIALGVLPVIVKRFRETNDKLLELQGAQS